MRIRGAYKLYSTAIFGGFKKDLKVNPRTKSEAFAIAELERLTGKEFPTVYPSWLVFHDPVTGIKKKLELDGYSKEMGVALEFSGPLHTKWYPDKESYNKYFARIRNDEAKKTICEEKGVTLIVLDMSMPKQHYRNYLSSRLADAGLMERPFSYISKQIAAPYRNPQLEKDILGGKTREKV